MLLQFKWVVRQITRISSDSQHATWWLMNGTGGTWWCGWQWELLTQILGGSLSAYCCVKAVTRMCASATIPLDFISSEHECCCVKQNRRNNDFEVCAEPKYSCEDQSGMGGTGTSRLSFRIVIFISYLWLPWRLVFACRNSWSLKVFCRSVLVQRHSPCAVLDFTQHRNYLRRAQSPS